MLDKVIREGKVAVLISPGYGAGWYSWHGEQTLLFHPTLVEMVEAGEQDKITTELCLQLLGESEDYYLYIGGRHQLQIWWVPVGTRFFIDEYDGSESLTTFEERVFITA